MSQNNGTFKVEKKNEFIQLLTQIHFNNKRVVKYPYSQTQNQYEHESFTLKSISNKSFVSEYSYYKDYCGVEDKIKEVITEENSPLIRALASQLTDKHLLMFFESLTGHLWNTDHEKLEEKFYKLCNNTHLLNKLTTEKQISILKLKKIIEQSWKILNLTKINTDFNLDFYNSKTFNIHEEVLKAAHKIQSNQDLKDYANKYYGSAISTILSSADRINHGRALQSLKNTINKPILSVQEENTLLKIYKNYHTLPSWSDIRNLNNNFYKKLEERAQTIDYNRYWKTLDTSLLTDEQKRSYSNTYRNYNQYKLVNGLISSEEEFHRIYFNLPKLKDINPESLTSKEVKQYLYVLWLKHSNEVTIDLISQNKLELAKQSLSAANCFYKFACGMAEESLVQVGNYIMSQPVRTLMLAGGCAIAPAGASWVAAYYLGLYAYTIYSSYGLLKEDITMAIDAYQRDDYYDLGKIAVKTATDTVILKSIGKTIRSGYKFAKLKSGSKQAKQVDLGLKAGLEAGEKIQVLEQTFTKANNKTITNVKNNKSNLNKFNTTSNQQKSLSSLGLDCKSPKLPQKLIKQLDPNVVDIKKLEKANVKIFTGIK